MTRFASLHEIATSASIRDYLSSPKYGDLIETAQVLKCALECADEAGKMIASALSKRSNREVATHETKISDADLVTETDVSVETAIRSRILSRFPDHYFVGEEGTSESLNGMDRKSKWVWIVDPIDGTTNFVHTFPVITVSIALAYGDETIMGVVFNPATNELWFAWEGCGAWMKQSDGKVIPIKTSGCPCLSSALVSTGFGVTLFRRKTSNVEAQMKLRAIVEHNNWVLMSNARDIRRIGSAACDLCYVAMGRTDVFFEFGIKEWDIAAGLVILHEAGGDSSTVGGIKPYSIRGRNVLVAASEALRIELNEKLIDKDAVCSIEAIEK